MQPASTLPLHNAVPLSLFMLPELSTDTSALARDRVVWHLDKQMSSLE